MHRFFLFIRLLISIALSLLLFVTLVITAYLSLPWIIEQRLLKILSENGFQDPHIEVGQLNLQETTLSHIRVGRAIAKKVGSRIRIPDIKLTYTLHSLLKGKIEKINIPKFYLRVSGVETDNQVIADDIPQMLALHQLLSALMKLPFDDLLINVVTLEMPERAYELYRLNLSRRPSDRAKEQKITLQFNLTPLHLELGDPSNDDSSIWTLHIEKPKVKADGLYDQAHRIFRGKLMLEGENITMPSVYFAAKKVNVCMHDIVLSEKKWSYAGHFYFERVINRNPYVDFGDFHVKGQLKSDTHALNLTMQLSDEKQFFTFHFADTYLYETNQHHARSQLTSVDFREQPLDLHYVVLALTRQVRINNGELKIESDARWHSGQPSKKDIYIHFKQLGIDIGKAYYSNINGDLHLIATFPFVSLPKQQLRIEKLHYGITLEKVGIDYHLFDKAGKTALTMNHLQGNLLKGKVTLNDVPINFKKKEQSFTVHLSDLNLDYLVRELELPGLSATGLLQGDLPMKLSQEGFEIINARLRVPEGGIIRYLPSQPPYFFKEEKNMKMLLKLVNHFDYQKFMLTLDTPLHGLSRANVDIFGKNPDFYGGLPFDFHMQIEAPLHALLSGGLDTWAIENYWKSKI